MIIPEYPSPLLLGNLRAFQHDRLQLFHDVAATCGDIGVVRVGIVRIVMINGAEQAHAVLSTANDATEKIERIRNNLHPLIGNGILNCLNGSHREQRAIITPAFYKKRIDMLVPLIAESTTTEVQSLADGDILDLYPWMMQLSLHIISQFLFPGSNPTLVRTLRTNLSAAVDAIIHLSTRLFQWPAWVPIASNRTLKRTIAHLHATLRALIAATPMPYADGSVLALLDTAYAQTSTNPILLRDELATLLFAGHETLGTALSWAFYLLTRHPAIYDRMQAEVDQVLGNNTPTLAQSAQLHYCQAVFKEVLRLYPSAYILNRVATQAFELPGGWHIPKGTYLGISPSVLHRRPDYWEDPEQFNPERFLDGRDKQIPRGAYLPFGDGPHVCIGSSMALLEGTLILALLAQRVRLHPTSTAPIAPNPLITLVPAKPILLRVERRTPALSRQQTPESMQVGDQAQAGCPFHTDSAPGISAYGDNTANA